MGHSIVPVMEGSGAGHPAETPVPHHTTVVFIHSGNFPLVSSVAAIFAREDCVSASEVLKTMDIMDEKMEIRNVLLKTIM
jgi:hypothetical protein